MSIRKIHPLIRFWDDWGDLILPLIIVASLVAIAGIMAVIFILLIQGIMQ